MVLRPPGSAHISLTRVAHSNPDRHPPSRPPTSRPDQRQQREIHTHPLTKDSPYQAVGRSCTLRCRPCSRRSAGLSRQCGARLARRQQRKRRRRRPSNVVMISPEYRVFTRAGHATPDSADGPGRPANSESRSARVPRRRRALRGKCASRRSAAASSPEDPSRCSSSAHCTSERRSKPTPASEVCGFPDRRGKCWWRLPCIHENALLLVGGPDDGQGGRRDAPRRWRRAGRVRPR